ncbi:hypothetical protein CRUP_001597 [Coryphaenoides rupestris]|nr:hypothetical protein CRUP_001597 [Coryphaenoides rupestris]
MGDMKTPDFEDLLAAFDIPDMVDPKAAIESGHNDDDDHDGPLKAHANGGGGGVATGDDVPLSAHDVGVSVIVKNVRSADAGEPDESPEETARRQSHHQHPRAPHGAHGNGIHNGSQAATSSIKGYPKNGWRVPAEKGPPPANMMMTSASFHQFSPISSAEEFDDDDKIEVDEPTPMNCSESLFRPAPNTFTVHPSCPKKEEQTPQSSKDPGPTKAEANNKYGTLKYAKPTEASKAKHENQAQQETAKTQAQERTEAVELSGSSSDPDLSVSQAKAKTSAKLSSCIAAIAALSAKKTSSRHPRVSDCPSIQKDSVPVSPHGESPKVVKESPGSPERQPEQESALEVAKRLLSREPDSPCSVTSECSSKESPASPTGTALVIPKVRIKTIKTSSGQIRRTVTRVLPEFDAEGKSVETSKYLPVMVSSALSTTTSNTVPTPQRKTSLNTVLASNPLELTKQMTIKPVATAFLPVSAVNKAGSQVINLKLANNTTVKATVIPASSMQSASSAIRKAANTTHQQTVMVPASTLANAKLVPKTIHLTNLNLLPKAISNTTCEIQQTAPCNKTKLQQQVKPQATQAGQLPKKVSRVQVFSNTQNTVVDAFNKVLSSINPVPIYVPNLSPPTSACISLPSRGYKCLECGDSFALDKSLSQHFERRSVRIEVTCNHCAKNLVFYNKCSLLSHAREHKDKGVVMQCSHLILKPIPTDQMIATSAQTCPHVTSSATVSTAQTQNSTTMTTQGKASGAEGTQTSVISAPSGAPLMAAMPLEDDGAKPCRQSLKCMECNETFQDESSLVIHYQHAVEFNAQKTCSICQMLLPNQCSFVSHQRIHQHKSPYICPECGISCRSVHFQSHVTKNCLHYTRRVGYRCVHCSVVFGDVAPLKSHIQSTHCEVFYKCPVCPMAFKSAQAMHSHGYTQHPGAKIGEPKLIYKCSMCDTVFTLQSLLSAHFDQHVGNHKVSVFKCPDCSMLYAQKQLMLDHIKVIHGTLKTIEGPPNLGIHLPLSTKPTHSNNNNNSNNNNKDCGHANLPDKKPGPLSLKTTNSNCNSGDHRSPQGPQVYTCGECDGVFTTREVFVSHVRRDHGKILKKHPCRQCDKSFSSSHSLCRHNRLKHKGLRKIYTCPHCPPLSQPFTKRALLDQHIQLMHNLKEPMESRSLERNDVESQPNKTTGSKRKPEEEEEEEDGDEGSPGTNGQQQPPVKKPKVHVLKGHNKCAVCGFAGAEDAAAFRLHIPKHKSDGSSHQCQECGLCYTSHHSLARHLFIVHRLKDHHNLPRRGRTDAGTTGAGADDGDLGVRLENQSDVADENDDGKPGTRCKVCRKVFDTEGQLNTHMRTHGMAFIRAKRLSAVEK